MEQSAKQQTAEKLRQATNVLVTVSKNPSVDQLAAAIGLTLMLNRLGKHATAVFSGEVPDVVRFLEPEKHFDDTVDSLRDFIISLDKNKADKLRYKVEDDVVRIFITPYKASISKADLNFGQGDFNVDAVVALGVERRDDLDAAIIAHGRILHDAAVISVTNGDRPGSLGAIDWHEPTASSLCEMLVSISEALQGGLLDGAISTALLTGIVEATDRFSNDKTTPKVMTMAAQLMAAGANQQLIANNLSQPAAKPSRPSKSEPGNKDVMSVELKAGERDAKPDEAGESSQEPGQSKSARRRKRARGSKKTLQEIEAEVKQAEAVAEEKVAQIKAEIETDDSDAADDSQSTVSDTSDDGGFQIQHDDQPESERSLPPVEAPADEPAPAEPSVRTEGLKRDDPFLGGQPFMNSPFSATTQNDSGNDGSAPGTGQPMLSHSEAAPEEPASVEPVKSEQDNAADSVDAARKAVEDAMSSQPFRPENQPLRSVGALPMPSDPQVLETSPIADQLPLPGPTASVVPPSQPFQFAPMPPVSPQPAPFPGAPAPASPFGPPDMPPPFPIPPVAAQVPGTFPLPPIQGPPPANPQPPAIPPFPPSQPPFN